MTCPAPFLLSNIFADLKSFVLVRVILLADIIGMEMIVSGMPLFNPLRSVDGSRREAIVLKDLRKA